VIDMAKKQPDPEAEPTPEGRATEDNAATPPREDRDYSQRALDVVRRATARHEDE